MEKNNTKGLYHRYIVSKSNGNPMDPLAEYFVLRLDKKAKDQKHVEACRKAILTYAEAIKEHLPYVAKDLIARYGN